MVDKYIDILQQSFDRATKIENDPESTVEQRQKAAKEKQCIINELKEAYQRPGKLQIMKHLAWIIGLTVTVAICFRKR